MALSLAQVGGAVLILAGCPILGAVPVIDWIVKGLAGKDLKRLGTGNLSVSAAFMYGGKSVGILCAFAEALRGAGSVWLARAFFPADPVWELLALMALLAGRYWAGRGAGTTNLFWGMLAQDWLGTLLVAIIGGGSFTIFRDRRLGQRIILGTLVAVMVVRHPTGAYALAIASLAVMEGWILQQVPDDLEISVAEVERESQRVFRFFRGDNAFKSLNHPLSPQKVGSKAANLALLKGLGYSVPEGWLFFAGDDFESLAALTQPAPDSPLIVRSSAIGEDGECASAAGQYQSFPDITDSQALEKAILDCLAAYDRPNAVQYRRDRRQSDAEMAVLVQRQVRGVFSGVAFSRDPLNPLSGKVAIEALLGGAERVVSGRMTPERYGVIVNGDEIKILEGSDGDVPRSLIVRVARLAREIEGVFQGIPQDIEWTYDGDRLWLLQARSVATLQPIWTRKIAAEVIPGTIRPLPWSINRPLTCGVWGEIFRIVLGDKARDLDFNATATLHFQRAYFNATLLGKIFQRMGLPPESLEFLTRGASFSRPPLTTTLANLRGLLGLLQRERRLIRDFERDNSHYFSPILKRLRGSTNQQLTPQEHLEQISAILTALERVTYYSILAPLSFALRQQIWRIDPATLDSRQTPEVSSLLDLAAIAQAIVQNLALDLKAISPGEFKAKIQKDPQSKPFLKQFERWRANYGYLSETATDISVPRWADDPEFCWNLLFKACQESSGRNEARSPARQQSWGQKNVQQRLNLKGRVAAVYSQLLAHLRWSFLAIGECWHGEGLLEQSGDIFFLEWSEIETFLLEGSASDRRIFQAIAGRKAQFENNLARSTVPYLVYGHPVEERVEFEAIAPATAGRLQGISASPGQITGKLKILTSLDLDAVVDKNTILVVPYTDAGWTMLLAKAGGIISEVGGSLSHGAIVAREYGIPAVMDIPHATQRLRNGQRAFLDGRLGIIEILD